MKLIIEIPEDIYKTSKEIEAKYEGSVNIPLELIANGIPLDDVKAEIGQGYCMANNDYDKGRNYGLYIATQILDNISKAESEVNK